MDLIKQYIVQSISVAANNLRLSTEKIEVVALLRDAIVISENVEYDIKEMKKITELSTLAIRLNEIYSYLAQPQIDFLKFSEKFKEHSQFLIKDLSHLLEIVGPPEFKKALGKLTGSKVEKEIADRNHDNPNKDKDERVIEVPLKEKGNIEDILKPETDLLKEKLILEDDKDTEDLLFQNYESEILKPIKSIDKILKQLSKNEIEPEAILKLAKIMNKNGEISNKIGFEIIANMHKIISKSLLLIRARELMPGKEVVESIRACLIVIVAVVKGKEVDITNYLNRAEEFGNSIQSIKLKETL
jgi:hypothetical protein